MQDVDTGRDTEKMWVMVTWTWKAGAAGAVCGHPATQTARPQGEKNRPAMELGRGCGGGHMETQSHAKQQGEDN